MKRKQFKRYPPGLTDDERADFLERQREFDDLLKAEGFVDIEAGTDSNLFDTYTVSHGEDFDPSANVGPAGHVRHLVAKGKSVPKRAQIVPVETTEKPRPRRREFRSLEALGESVYQHQTEFEADEGQVVGLGSSEVYEFWRQVGLHVHDLPPSYPHRAFLVDLSESGDLLGTARAHGLTRDVARWAFKRFLERIGLARARMAQKHRQRRAA